MQYTIRNIPEYLDAALRSAAREQGKSLNEMAILALVRGAGLGESLSRKRDLGEFAGSWQEDPTFDGALAAQDVVDGAMWPSLRYPKRRTRKKSASSTPARQKRARGAAA
jgi:hypothetical protein